MEHTEIQKKKWDAVVGAAAIGAAGLPSLWLATNVLQVIFKKGLISDVAFVVSMYLAIPLGAFGLLGILMLALLGAVLIGIGAFYWHFVLKA